MRGGVRGRGSNPPTYSIIVLFVVNGYNKMSEYVEGKWQIKQLTCLNV